MASSPRKLISRKLAPPRGAPPEAAPGLSSPEVSADFAEWPSEEPAPGDAAAGDADSVPSELETVPSEADPASELLELDLSAGPGSTETLLREVPTLGRAIAASLVSLDLSGNSLGPKLEPRAHLGALSALRALSLARNGLRRVDAIVVLAPTLRRVDLSGNMLASVPQALSELVALEDLDASGNAIANLRDCERLRPLARLATLRLSCNPVADEREYREFVLHCCGALVTFDAEPVIVTARRRAVARFGGGSDAPAEGAAPSGANAEAAADHDTAALRSNVRLQRSLDKMASSHDTLADENQRLAMQLNAKDELLKKITAAHAESSQRVSRARERASRGRRDSRVKLRE